MLKNTRLLVLLALFVALDIVLTRVFAITTPMLRVSFGFLPIALSGIMFGPIAAGLAALVSDLLGATLFGITPHPGITLTSTLVGVTFGLFLHKNGESLIRIVLACVVNIGVLSMFVQPIWLAQLTGSPYWGLVLTRLPALAILFIVQILTIKIVWTYLAKFFRLTGVLPL